MVAMAAVMAGTMALQMVQTGAQTVEKIETASKNSAKEHDATIRTMNSESDRNMANNAKKNSTEHQADATRNADKTKSDLSNGHHF